jgi:hypothetical protein
VNRAWIVSAMLAMGGVASAGPDSRPAPAATPAATPAPAPDGPGVRVRPGPADNRRIVGILDVRVEGVPEAVKDSFQRELEEQFDVKQYWLGSRDYMKQRMQRSTKWTEGCLAGPCLAEVRAQTGAELVLLAALTGSGTSFGYVVTLVRTDTGRVLQQESDRCDVCTVREAMNKATLAMVGLLNNVPDRLPDEAAEQGAAINTAVGKVQRELAARDQHATRVGVAITAIGVAVAVVGGVLYALDNKSSYAAPTAIGGGALTAGGIIALTF